MHRQAEKLPSDTTAATADDRRSSTAGVIYALLAYGAWGLVPIYFKAVAHVPALQVLGHRVVWSVVLLILLLAGQGRLKAATAILRDRKTLLTLAITTILIATNWYVFIWAVAHDQVRQASLGYYINPLVNVLLGFVFLGERLRPWQLVSLALAASGVLIRTFEQAPWTAWAQNGTLGFGDAPWIALVLAGSFGIYGLLRKTAKVDAVVGLTVETTMLLPVALVYLAWQFSAGTSAFGTVSRGQDLLLISAGVVTALPLIWFTCGAKRLRLSTMGFMQYIAPTGHLLLAVFAYGEPFEPRAKICFALIWIALAIYSIDALRARKSRGM